MKPPKGRPAFVLLMVLAVLAMAGAALGIAARTCGQRALAAASRQRRLQVKWGVLSCRSFLLPRAERILAEEEATRRGPSRQAVKAVPLGDIRFVAVVCDEQALLNVNMLAKRYGTANVASYVGQVQSAVGRPLPVRPLPAEPDRREICTFPTVFASFDQLWAFDHPSQLIAPDGRSAREGVTCWSNGKVHFKRADPNVLRRATAGALTEYQHSQLVEFCSEQPDGTLTEAMVRLKLTDEEARRVRSVLTDESLCHSVWIIAEGDRRRWHRFFVKRLGDPENDSRSWTFRW